MDYFKILTLTKEPFSNSPEPEFFFQSTGHLACLQQLELAIRLRRGLNVVMGEVGTGKTTLCRQLLLRIAESDEEHHEIETHLLLDPSFSTPREFLTNVAVSFGLPGIKKLDSEWRLKEAIKNYLFQKWMDEQKTVVIIIDEGQKLPDFCREILREFLNYETNENKLLQIVIFAQNEFAEILKGHQNFADRVNQYYLLEPLNFKESRAMIRFRLARAGRPAEARELITFSGMWAIFLATRGYPRRIITLCHQLLLTLIIQNRASAGWFLVRFSARRLIPEPSQGKQWKSTTITLAVIFFILIVVLFLYPPAALKIKQPSGNRIEIIPQAATQVTKSAPPIKPVPAATPPTPAVSVPAAPTVKPGEIQKQDMEGQISNPSPVPVTVPVPAPPAKVAQTAPPPPPVAPPPQAPPVKAAPVEKPSQIPATLAKTAPATARVEEPLTGDPATKKKLPTRLGQLRIHEGDSFTGLLREIYGNNWTTAIRVVTKANPHVARINQVRAGERITLPAIAATTSILATQKVWVQIARREDIEEAYRLYKSYPSDMPPIRMIPFWNLREGLIFMIVLKTGFADPAEAKEAIRSLPSAIAAGAEIMRKPEKDTVFFAN
ncbi:MAG: ExeA family protein [Syntrophales bacterium]